MPVSLLEIESGKFSVQYLKSFMDSYITALDPKRCHSACLFAVSAPHLLEFHRKVSMRIESGLHDLPVAPRRTNSFFYEIIGAKYTGARDTTSPNLSSPILQAVLG